jgi:hypothetical protein
VSIFKEFYTEKPFVDRYVEENGTIAVDVIIPLIHANELWETNLKSFYREIPINNLLIGDAGCLDKTIDAVSQFPRVKIFDHRHFVSQGFSIRKLIEAVETERFIYLHSDVYLPLNWFIDMEKYSSRFDWVECSPHLTILYDTPLEHRNVDRPFSGAQVGVTKSFKDILPIIEDDFLLRNEDIILAELLQGAGYSYKRIHDVFHYHQEMDKESPWRRKVKPFKLQYEMNPNDEIKIYNMQVKGLIKYLTPREDMPLDVYEYYLGLRRLKALNALDRNELHEWIKEVNPDWLSFHKKIMRQERAYELRRAGNSFFKAAISFLKAIFYFIFGLPEE